jgi:hypothetical protein
MYRSDLIVSLQVDWWSKGTQSVASNAGVSLWTTNLVLQWYPSATGKWFVNSGLGIGFVNANDKLSFNDPETNARGLGYQVGVGYDIPRWEHLSLVPYAGIFGLTAGKDANTTAKTGGTVAQLGIGLSWR